ncbi:ABC transporter permease [Alphaproteobacteria bacterium]|nr:ABC transporter permease [Alphaproteobacteria bacterium]MDC0462065.1 ABC transporter permease [Alphaproteobacteria bacterium]
MQIFSDSFTTAFFLIISGDPDLYEIIFLSIKVSLTSLLGSIIIGLPVGAFLAIHRFKMRSVLLSVLNALMGMPPVVVGLIVYLYLSRSGPLGFLSLLYSPKAMIIAQMLLVTPIIAALSAQIIEDLHIEYKDLFRSLNVSTSKAVVAYIIDARMSLLTVVLAGFGRAISEVGAVSIVGGNIDHLTRVMTTAIALETSKGNLSLALALGIILLTIALGINLLAAHAKNWVMEKQDV